jgi:DNA-binding response OmpR family regulator
MRGKPFTPEATSTKIAAVSPARILVVDADVDLRDEVRDALAGHGFEVRSAGPGDEVGDFKPDLVVIDLRDGSLGTAIASELGLSDGTSGAAVGRKQFAVGDIVVDPAAHLVERGGIRVDVTATELALLTALVRRAGQVASRTELLEELWGAEAVTGNVIEVHVSSLRRKLEKHGPRVIHTVRGIGYRI